MTTTPSSPELLDSAYRVVRRLTPPDSPWEGLLARDGDEAVVLVDAEHARDTARRGPRGPHVLQPSDVARTATGHRLVFPWCVEPLADFVARHRPEGIDDGEVVTIALSLHRGLLALAPGRGEDEARGSWWLTDTGCPTFAVTGGDAPPVGETTRARWAELAAATANPATGSRLERLAPGDRAVVAGLVAIAPPQALTLTRTPPRRVAAAMRTEPVDVDEADEPWALAGLLRRTVGRFVDPEWGGRVGDAVDSMRRRVRRPVQDSAGGNDVAPRRRPTARRRALALGGVVAAGVLAVGLLWPSDTPGAEAGLTADTSPSAVVPGQETETSGQPDSPTALPTALPSAPQTPAASPTPGVAAHDPAAAVADLLARAADCAVTATCDEVFEKADAVPATKLPIEPASITLLDDLGGIAVFRVESADAGGPSLVVILVEMEGEWRIRDARPLETR